MQLSTLLSKFHRKTRYLDNSFSKTDIEVITERKQKHLISMVS